MSRLGIAGSTATLPGPSTTATAERPRVAEQGTFGAELKAASRAEPYGTRDGISKIARPVSVSEIDWQYHYEDDTGD